MRDERRDEMRVEEEMREERKIFTTAPIFFYLKILFRG